VNPNLPPQNPDEPEHPSLFEEFINRNLDLNGLDDADDSGPDAHSPDTDAEGRLVFEMEWPAGPVLRGALGASGPVGARLPSWPLSFDARWQRVTMRQQPAKLRIYKPRIGYEMYAGQLVIPLGPHSPRQMDIIPDARPGWTAVRYQAGFGIAAELIEWRGNKAALHHLRINHREITGFIKQDDMPAVRRVRFTWAWLEISGWLIGAMVAILLLLAIVMVAQRVPLSGGPSVSDLQAQIATLEAQVQSLQQAQPEAPPSS
jgi:hypothetical protein